MDRKCKRERRMAVQRFFRGEEPRAICASIGRSRSWLYKWVARYTAADPAWCEEASRRPRTSPHRTPVAIEELVELVRLSLYNKGLFCGDQAIAWELDDLGVRPLLSLSTIGRILRRRELTRRPAPVLQPECHRCPAQPVRGRTHPLPGGPEHPGCGLGGLDAAGPARQSPGGQRDVLLRQPGPPAGPGAAHPALPARRRGALVHPPGRTLAQRGDREVH